MPEIRRIDAGYGQFEALRALILEAFASMAGRIAPPSSALRLSPSDIAAEAASGAIFVAEEAGRPLGCIFCRRRGRALYLAKLAVRPDRQGQGLGRALMGAAEAEARRLGLAALELETRIELVENHAAFAAMGFVKCGENAHPGFDRPTSIAMRRSL